MSLIGTLCWRTKEGHDLLLKQVSAQEFRELKPELTGIPTVFAVWPSLYEQSSVDRKLLCAREAVNRATWEDWGHEKAGERLALRAIELWEEGFGSE